ncbi:MAG: hypothetical protein DWI00_16750 [Planctomycetota bacterium]|nr:MAG: hypothetical protein DWI00_16750 [Planctomycetota bacterium]
MCDAFRQHPVKVAPDGGRECGVATKPKLERHQSDPSEVSSRMDVKVGSFLPKSIFLLPQDEQCVKFAA